MGVSAKETEIVTIENPTTSKWTVSRYRTSGVLEPNSSSDPTQSEVILTIEKVFEREFKSDWRCDFNSHGTVRAEIT